MAGLGVISWGDHKRTEQGKVDTAKTTADTIIRTRSGSNSGRISATGEMGYTLVNSSDSQANPDIDDIPNMRYGSIELGLIRES